MRAKLDHYSKKTEDDLFLPDLCAMRMVFVVIVIAQLAAFVVALSPLNVALTERLNNLGMISLFVQWCALCSCSVLCLARRFLKKMNNIRAGVVSYILILCVVVIMSELALWLVYFSEFENNSEWNWEFRLRNFAITALVAAPVLRYFYVQHQWRRNLRVEANARLQALQARIRPHFLFNSMNTIASLIPVQPEDAENAVHNLADLFRASLSDTSQLITLRDEFTLCRQYLEIECQRLGDRLKIDWDVAQLPDDALLPPLLIQPLLENAIYHGIEPIMQGGTINVRGTLENKQILINVSNPLRKDAKDLEQKSSSGYHIAQENIRERLEALYASRGTLKIEYLKDHYQIKLSFPYQNEYEDPNRR